MESISCGTPVVASNIGGVPELIKDGETGELFTPGDKEDIKKHIETLLSDKEKLERYSTNSRKVKYPEVGDYVDELIKEIYSPE